MIYDIDERPIIETLYVARPVDLPPLTAQAAFEVCREAAAVDGVDGFGRRA